MIYMYERLIDVLCCNIGDKESIKTIINKQEDKMFREVSKRFGFGVLAIMMLVLVIGCSSENPMSSITNNINESDENAVQLSSTSGNVELFGRIASVDTTTRQIMLVDDPTVIVVSETAEVVLRGIGDDIPITLAEINPGDSAEVRGDYQGDGSLLADRVRIKTEDNQNELETGGRVETIDPDARTMTFVGNPMLINVALYAEIVQKNGGAEVHIELSEISPGDSVDVRGGLQGDGSLLVDRVRLRNGFDDDFMADHEFTSVINTIDYTNLEFTVDSRTETILVDENTFIFMKEDRSSNTDFSSSEGDDDDDDDDDLRQRLEILFTDLVIGDTVEVYANQVDPNTLLAVVVELEDGAFENGMQVEFKDLLASVDSETGTVTFLNETWIGVLAENAELFGLNGEVLTLSDFLTGELVEVKGFATSGDTISIVHMHKDNNFVADYNSNPSIFKNSGESITQRRYSYNNTGTILKIDKDLSYIAFEKDEQVITVSKSAKMILLPSREEIAFDYRYLRVGDEIIVHGDEDRGEIIGEVFEVKDLIIVSTTNNKAK